MHDMDPEQNETALQIFTAAYKTLPPMDQSFALLRKATRLDRSIKVVEVTPEGKCCTDCGVDASPRWHRATGKVKREEGAMEVDGEPEVDGDGKGWQCHQCWFAADSL
jgi:hypothetical protein